MRSFKERACFGISLVAVVLFPAFAFSAAAGGDVVVTSATMEADSKGKVVTFKGDVVAEKDFLLCSDELKVYYGENEEIKELIAVGNVRVSKGDKRAMGDRAVYDKGKNAIVITGNAVVEQCSDVVRGGKITVYTDSGNMTVEGGETQGKRIRAVIMPEKKCVEESGKVTPFSKGGLGGIDEKFNCERPR
ncbi:MAG TPA: lipopolysaccharide transport periplasmic protein LptA [Thermodesulfobacteriota bacterium]|nr:lipopolysaccharide transport periplasmic protein LptA [Thermodesulfobacteriota bacterium]